jgi:hypothetical protein
MILRIFSEGQYELEESLRSQLRELDRAVEAAIESGDEAAFKDAYAKLIELVRSQGTPLADDDLRTSELMLPPADVSLEEARREFSDQGLIPD